MKRLGSSFVLFLVILSGCFRPGHLRVTMTNESPPKFMFDGPGRWSECCSTFFEFAVMEQTPDDPNPWDSHSNIDESPHLVWRVVPPNGYVNIPEAPDIRYGEVPRGWTQTHPKSGGAPVLLEGKRYVAGQPHLSPEGTLLFMIQNGKPVIAR